MFVCAKDHRVLAACTTEDALEAAARLLAMPDGPAPAPMEIVVDPCMFIVEVRPTGSEPVLVGRWKDLAGYTLPTATRVEFWNGKSRIVVDLPRRTDGDRYLHQSCMTRRKFELVLREVR